MYNVTIIQQSTHKKINSFIPQVYEHIICREIQQKIIKETGFFYMYNIVFKHKLLQSSNCIGCKNTLTENKESNDHKAKSNIWGTVDCKKMNIHIHTLNK